MWSQTLFKKETKISFLKQVRELVISQDHGPKTTTEKTTTTKQRKTKNRKSPSTFELRTMFLFSFYPLTWCFTPMELEIRNSCWVFIYLLLKPKGSTLKFPCTIGKAQSWNSSKCWWLICFENHASLEDDSLAFSTDVYMNTLVSLLSREFPRAEVSRARSLIMILDCIWIGSFFPWNTKETWTRALVLVSPLYQRQPAAKRGSAAQVQGLAWLMESNRRSVREDCR